MIAGKLKYIAFAENVLLSYPKTQNYKKFLNRFKAVSPNALVVQSLDDFKKNRVPVPRNNAAYSRIKGYHPANIRWMIDDDYFTQEFLKFISSIDHIFSGIADGDNLLYGPVFEWCMDTVKVSKDMETNSRNLFTVGDGAGLSQGIMYSAVTGIIAAKCITERMASDEA